jgi:hypothetical protein
MKIQPSGSALGATIEDIDLADPVLDQWAEGQVLMWDGIGTVHNAVPDYHLDEPRYMLRVQVMATKDYARLAA